jgi:hypothetical protein
MVHCFSPRPAWKGLAANLLASVVVFAPSAYAAKVPNNPPVISGVPSTAITLGSSFSFQPTASDPEGQAVTFKIRNRPRWTVFDTSTGRLTGKPIKVGTSGSILIGATDGNTTAWLPAFQVTTTAEAANRAPTISGTPVTTATVSQPYAFRPTAADLDNDVLTFSVSAKPYWASFDSATGTLYGTPTPADVGTSGGVAISASDGKAQATLAPFSITVNPATSGSVTVRWSAPTLNTDGSELTNLAGYKVHYGTTSGAYTTSLSVAGAETTSVVVEELPQGAVYFAIVAVNAAGTHSDYSSEVSKVL